jgi:hypothetical protein
MGMAEGADGDPSDQVEIGFPVVIPDMNAQSPCQDNGKPFISRHDVLI